MLTLFADTGGAFAVVAPALLRATQCNVIVASPDTTRWQLLLQPQLRHNGYTFATLVRTFTAVANATASKLMLPILLSILRSGCRYVGIMQTRM